MNKQNRHANFPRSCSDSHRRRFYPDCTQSTHPIRYLLPADCECTMSPAAAMMRGSLMQQGAVRQVRQAFGQQESMRPCPTTAFMASSQGSFMGAALKSHASTSHAQQRASSLMVLAIKNGATLDRPLRVAVVGGGPAGSCTAETLAKGGIETYLFERKMDNCKVCVVPYKRLITNSCRILTKPIHPNSGTKLLALRSNAVLAVPKERTRSAVFEISCDS